MPEFSASQIDRLGMRLRRGVSDADRRLYFDYRERFEAGMLEIESALRVLFPEFPPVGRMKRLEAAVAKLNRQRTRLSTMQDIAGCRIVVPGLHTQDDVVRAIEATIEAVQVVGIRASPHAG